MQIGSLNYRALIEYPVRTKDTTYGGDIITWTTLDTVWCNVQDNLPSKSERVISGLTVNTNQVRLRFRYRADIDSAMRITIYRPDATLYQISSGPAVLGRKEGIELMLETYSSKGQ